MNKISTHFSREEFACKCSYDCGFASVDVVLLRLLEEARTHFGEPITITSAWRCDKHNTDVGGGLKSQHKIGRACDIVVKNIHSDKVYEFFNNRYPTSLGLGRYPNNGFTHIDTRDTKSRWVG